MARAVREKDLVGFQCPGCGHLHSVSVAPGGWRFDGNLDRPTLSPSVLVRSTFGPERADRRCHSFVEGGRIRFLSDCTHKLAGQTVDLPELRD